MIQPVRTLAIAGSLVIAFGAAASAQSSRGTMGVPRAVTASPPSTVRVPPPSSRGVMGVPRVDSPTGPRGGNLPRMTTSQSGGHLRGRRVGAYGRGSGYGGSGYGAGSTTGVGMTYGAGSRVNGGYGHRFEPGMSRRWRPGYTRWGVGAGCVGTCFRIGIGGRTSRFFGSFTVGYPFAVPIVVPYFYYSAYESYVEPVEESYVAEPEAPRAASKLIVIGGGGSGGDALTIESLGDSVRLNWLGANRPAREVRLFVADSAQRQLATRSASPAAPTATFEIATLSAPVAFAGVTVTFADGVTTTTMVPYRAGVPR